LASNFVGAKQDRLMLESSRSKCKW